jgi:hypothetical protein
MVTLSVLVLSFHCTRPLPTITLKNLTDHEIDIYIDSLFIIKVAQKSEIKLHPRYVLPSSIRIQTKRGYIYLPQPVESIGQNTKYYHTYNLVAKVGDSILHEYFFYGPDLNIDLRKDTTFIFR